MDKNNLTGVEKNNFFRETPTSVITVNREYREGIFLDDTEVVLGQIPSNTFIKRALFIPVTKFNGTGLVDVDINLNGTSTKLFDNVDLDAMVPGVTVISSITDKIVNIKSELTAKHTLTAPSSVGVVAVGSYKLILELVLLDNTTEGRLS